MGCLQHLRTLSKPLGYRGVLQTDQADPAGLRLFGALQAGHPLAALVGTADVPAAALSGLALAVAAQLRTRVHHDPGRGLGQVRPE